VGVQLAQSDILAAIDEDRVVDLTCRLIDVPSPTGDELACAEVLADYLDTFGIAVELQRFGERRANVVARVGTGDGGARPMLCGHLDTTGTGDLRLDYSGYGPLRAEDVARAELRDGMISGLGAFNQKGGLAAAAEALVVLATSSTPVRGEVLLGALAGETGKGEVRGAQRDYLGPAFAGGGVGATWLLDHLDRLPDAVVITGPSGCQVVNAQPGYLMVKLTVLGRSVYQASKVPAFDEVSGIDLASRVVSAIGAWEPRYRDAHKLACGMGTLYPNVTVGAIEGGWPYKPAQAPGACNLYIDLRVPPGLDPSIATRELEAVVRSAIADRGGFALDVYQSGVPGALTPVDCPLVRSALQARAEVTGSVQTRVEDEQLAIGNDGRVFATRGVPFVKCGPGSLSREGQRINVEQVSIRELGKAARIYTLLALDLAHQQPAESGP
jgi:acetylornithine deacetylase/succinyl-diaminopimelate desuccinylase-like protein